MISRQGELVNLCTIWKRTPARSASQPGGGTSFRMGQNLKPNTNAPSDKVEGMVLVLNAQFLKKPKRLHLWRPIQSMVRLHLLNEPLCAWGHIVHLGDCYASSLRGEATSSRDTSRAFIRVGTALPDSALYAARCCCAHDDWELKGTGICVSSGIAARRCCGRSPNQRDPSRFRRPQ